MKEFHPHSDTRAPADTDTAVSASNRRRDFGAGAGLLATIALLAVALSLGLFFWSTAHKQTATGDNAAPSLTTGSAPSSPNNSGVTPPASR
jgi:ferric-dicitrate binding protein FerR (iron transport regulator)